ncbi:unnamed protein product, partial [Prorocentrum cordatum]
EGGRVRRRRRRRGGGFCPERRAARAGHAAPVFARGAGGRQRLAAILAEGVRAPRGARRRGRAASRPSTIPTMIIPDPWVLVQTASAVHDAQYD